MARPISFSGPLVKYAGDQAIQEFYNNCHSPSNGKFCGSGSFSPGVAKYLNDQYQMKPETAQRLGLAQEGTKLLIPFRDENGRTTSFKWRDTAVTAGEGRWGPPNKVHGLSVYENKSKTGPLFVVESPSEGLILAAHNQRVVFFDGADSLVSRGGLVDKSLHSRLVKLVKGNHTVLIPDNDVRGEAFAKVVEPLVSQRINPPPPNKDLREYLIKSESNLNTLLKGVKGGSEPDVK